MKAGTHRRYTRIRKWLVLSALTSMILSGCKGSDSTEVAVEVTDEDRAYMRDLARQHGGRLALDFSDEVQVRFARARIAAASKPSTEYAEIYTSIENARARHLTRKQGLTISPQDTGAPKAHIVSSFGPIANTNNFEATAFSTIKGGDDWSFVDVVVWDENWNQISNYGSNEAYGDGKKLRAVATGSLSSIPMDTSVSVDSFAVFSKDGDEEYFYAISEFDRPKPAPGCFLDDPRDKNYDGITTICLNVDSADCDYPDIGETVAKIPIKGQIIFNHDILQIHDDGDTYLKLVEEGGGPHEMLHTSFYQWLNIDPTDPRRAYWDIPRDSGVFEGILFKSYDHIGPKGHGLPIVGFVDVGVVCQHLFAVRVSATIGSACRTFPFVLAAKARSRKSSRAVEPFQIALDVLVGDTGQGKLSPVCDVASGPTGITKELPFVRADGSPRAIEGEGPPDTGLLLQGDGPRGAEARLREDLSCRRIGGQVAEVGQPVAERHLRLADKVAFSNTGAVKRRGAQGFPHPLIVIAAHEEATGGDVDVTGGDGGGECEAHLFTAPAREEDGQIDRHAIRVREMEQVGARR